MKLRMKTIEGDRFVIETEDDCSVLSLKRVIEVQQAIAIPHQTLIYRGKILEDCSHLSAYKIVDNCFIVCLVRKPETVDSSSASQYLESHPNIVDLRHEYQATGNTAVVLDAFESWDASSIEVIRNNQIEFLDLLNRPLTELEMDRITQGMSAGHARLEEYVASATPGDIAELTGISDDDVSQNLPEVVNILRSLPDTSVETILNQDDEMPTDLNMSDDERAIVGLTELGFPYEQCVQAYHACGGNEQLAANLLLSGTFQ